MIDDCGDLSIESANDANVPVNIDVSQMDAEIDNDSRWRLTADNYMPRRGYLNHGAYEVRSESKDELLALVAKHILPLYRIAVKKLEDTVAGKGDGLYYWSDKW